MSDTYDFWEAGICYDDAVPIPYSPVGLTGTGEVLVRSVVPRLVSRISVSGVLRDMDLAFTDVSGGVHSMAENLSSEDGFDTGEFAPTMVTEIKVSLHRDSFVKEILVFKTTEVKYTSTGTSTGGASIGDIANVIRQLTSQEVTIYTTLTGDPKSVMADWPLAHLMREGDLSRKDYSPMGDELFDLPED